MVVTGRTPTEPYVDQISSRKDMELGQKPTVPWNEKVNIRQNGTLTLVRRGYMESHVLVNVRHSRELAGIHWKYGFIHRSSKQSRVDQFCFYMVFPPPLWKYTKSPELCPGTLRTVTLFPRSKLHIYMSFHNCKWNPIILCSSCTVEEQLSPL